MPILGSTIDSRTDPVLRSTQMGTQQMRKEQLRKLGFFASWPTKVTIVVGIACACAYLHQSHPAWSTLRPVTANTHDSDALPDDPQALVQTAQKHWRDDDVRYEGIVHPRDVFLWYTKGEKTGSTVAATLIAHAYQAANLTIANHRGYVMAAAPGAYASVSHKPYSDSSMEELRTLVNRPVLLVVSTREGRDWIISNAFRAERVTSKRHKIGGCESLWQGSGKWSGAKNQCKKYSTYLPSGESKVVPWWVIRHEKVVEDTCDMLKRLGLTCNPALATGQVSRKDLDEDLLKCEVPVQQEDVDCINQINQKLWKSAPPR